MAITVANEPDPRTLGAYAFEAGRQPAIRENLVESRRLAQQQGQFDAQQAANAQQLQQKLQAESQQQQAANSAAMQKEAMQQQGYAELNAQKAEQADLNRQQQWQNAEANRQQKEQLAYEDRVAKGLKDGSLYYDPRQKQQLSELDKNIAQVSNDPSIAEDHREEMLAALTRQRRSVIPSVRSVEDRPVPIEERAAGMTVVHTHDGRVIPLSALGRGTQPGDRVGTITNRNGQDSIKWEAVDPPKPAPAPKPTAEEKAYGDPLHLQTVKEGIFKEKQRVFDSEYEGKKADWDEKKAQHDHEESVRKAEVTARNNAKPADDKTPLEVFTPKRFGEPLPRKRYVSPEEVEYELHSRSGGRAGIPRPGTGRELDGGLYDPIASAPRPGLAPLMPQSPESPLQNLPVRNNQPVDSNPMETLPVRSSVPAPVGADAMDMLRTPGMAPMPNAMPPAGQFNEIKRPPNVPVSAVFVRSDDEATFNRLPPGTAVYDENGEGGIK